MKISELKDNLAEEDSPVVAATEVGFFVSDGLEDKTLTIYEGFLIKDLEISLLRQGYTKPAWSYTVGMSHLLAIAMLYVMACYYNESKLKQKYTSWLNEARKIIKDNRKHYVLEAIDLISSGKIEELAVLLLNKRNGNKPFEFGPYHNEYFPFEYLVPEKEILEERHGSATKIAESVVDLISEIELKYNG